MITVITKPNCSNCVRLKAQLDSKGIEYKEVDYVPYMDILIDNNIMSLPVVIEDLEYISNYKIKE